jgi:tetratricopeptide (TPR) repeat protein
MHRCNRATGHRILAMAVALALAGLWPTSLGWAHPDISEAEDAAAHAIEESPDDPALYVHRATLERMRHDWDAAAASYTKALELGADRDRIDVSLASVLLEAGLPKTALVRVELALGRDQDNGAARLTRARILSRSSRHADAAADYARAVAVLKHPEPGVVLEAMNAQLLRSTQDAVATDGEMIADSNAQADTREENIVSALAVADSAMRKLSIIPSIQERAIELETELERYDAAVARIDSMLARAPRHEVWIAQRGDLLTAQGKQEEAVQSYERALALINERPAGRRSSRISLLATTLRKKLDNRPDSEMGENP